MRLRSDALPSRIPEPCAVTSGASQRPPTSVTIRREAPKRTNMEASQSGGWREPVQAGIDVVVSEDGGDPLVVNRRVGVDPVALRIDGQRQDACNVRTLHQDLLPWCKRR